jgi:hypothetical protein
MATINDNVSIDETDVAESDGGDSKEGKRRSYPVRELKYIIEFVTKIYTELGPNSYHSKENIAKTHNLSADYIKQILSTCQQYKLLDLKHGTGYKVSALFVKIHKPLDDEEKTSAVVESIQSVEIFHSLINDYEGHTVPALNGIVNKIHRDFQLKEALAQKVADIFVRNLNDFNLIDLRGDLQLRPKNSGVKEEPKQKQQEQKVNEMPPIHGHIVITIPLKGVGGRKASLHIPEDYSDADLKKVAKFVDALRDEE